MSSYRYRGSMVEDRPPIDNDSAFILYALAVGVGVGGACIGLFFALTWAIG